MRAFSFVSVLFMLVILLSTNACKKDPIETNIVDTVHYDTIEVSNIPSISFVDIQPSVVQEFE
ncbi:MAG: hypothetical protein MRY83_19225, partial [Flavobacteriales bacterium]|nr:hypothetical protein [Flavobacteriales bacterium]